MAENIIAGVIVGLGVFYIAALWILQAGLRKAVISTQSNEQFNPSKGPPSISIVVSARNEALNLERLISCLISQDYPRDKFEIVLVDDRSEDGTWSILETTSNEYSFVQAIRITNLEHGFAPKKRALDMAIRRARGEIILLTDADCTPPPTWVRSMVEYYGEDVVGVIGYSPYRFDTPVPAIVQGMLALDYFSIYTVAAASSGLGKAVTASGTNLSYRKKTFLDIGGFESVKEMISGDDDLFVNEVARKQAGVFAFALDSRAYVPSSAPKSWRQFWNQRIRYASKGKHYGGVMTAGLVAYYLLNLFLVAGVLSVLAGLNSMFLVSVAMWAVKAIAEFGFLGYAAVRFQETSLLTYFLPTAILHPFYITVFGFLGLFAKFKWKE